MYCKPSIVCCVDDVGVIDEAQMIQNNERGFAWTRVILGKPLSSVNILVAIPCVLTVS